MDYEMALQIKAVKENDMGIFCMEVDEYLDQGYELKNHGFLIDPETGEDIWWAVMLYTPPEESETLQRG